MRLLSGAKHSSDLQLSCLAPHAGAAGVLCHTHHLFSYGSGEETLHFTAAAREPWSPGLSRRSPHSLETHRPAGTSSHASYPESAEQQQNRSVFIICNHTSFSLLFVWHWHY